MFSTRSLIRPYHAWSAAWVLALSVALALTPGCETTPDPRPADRASTEAVPTVDEYDELAADLDDHERRLAEAAQVSSPQRPAPPIPDLNASVDWLPAGREPQVAEESAEAVPNVAPSIEIDATDVAAAPVEAPAPAPVIEESQSLTELVSLLDNRLIDEGGQGLRPWLARASLTLAEPARELTDADLGTLPSEDRQLVLAYQRLFTHLGRSLGRGDDTDRDELELAAEELMEQLRLDRRLTIRTVELCTRVNGYGIYEPFESRTFVAGRERPAIVYIELDNFATRQNAAGRFEVRLRQEIVLYNASDGLAVWRVNPTEIKDESRNRRRDFFLVQVVKLPATLNVGRYLLKVTITDEHGAAVDEATIPIEFVAEPIARR